MSKATVAQVINHGFSATMFGDPADFATETTGYVALLLNEATIEVRTAVGTTVYDSADAGGIEELRIIEAELYLTAARLWRRRATFLAADLNTSRVDDDAPDAQAQALKNAQTAEDQAWKAISKLTSGTTETGGLAVGLVQSGPFSEVST